MAAALGTPSPSKKNMIQRPHKIFSSFPKKFLLAPLYAPLILIKKSLSFVKIYLKMELLLYQGSLFYAGKK